MRLVCLYVLKSSDLSSDLGSDLGSDLRPDLRSDLSSDLSFEHARSQRETIKQARTMNNIYNQQPEPQACPYCLSVFEPSDPSSDLGSDLGSDLRSDLSSDLS